MALDTSQIGSTDRQPWGTLPTERYLLQHWDPDSDEEAREQYRRLIEKFLAGGKIYRDADDAEPSPMRETLPSDDEIDSILKPWRSERLRKIAVELNDPKNEPSSQVLPILRVHYGDDKAFQEVLDEDQNSELYWEPQEQWWRILSDKEAFDVGSEWRRALCILPELVARGRGLDHQKCLSFEVINTADGDAEANDEDVEDYIQFESLHKTLAIFDEQSVEDGTLKVYHLDCNGNVIRSTRASPEDLPEWRISRSSDSRKRHPIWLRAKVGKRYKANGSVGRILYERLAEL